MKRRWSILYPLLFMALLMLSACEFSASTANIKNAALARDEAGTQPTSTFEPNETFYLVADLANAPDETKVKAVWSAVNVGAAAAPNTVIDQAELTTGSGKLTFNLTPDGSWAPGAYKVELFLNGELNQTLDLTVKGEIAQATLVPPATATPEPPTAEPTATTSLEDVRAATIRIQAQGTFIDPEYGLMTNAAGQGSGFIIDPSGIAVTNNHVVTGSAFLQVYVEGEDRPRNAKILGVSECSDLAVIDIEGDDFPALQWREGSINTGLDIYVAGFPFYGNEEFTLTRGIISKAKVDGETNWASVDHVLEVDATINPGNSGGPLVDADGRLVGVNYAGNDETSQYYSIARDEATPIIEQLRTGKDVNSLGINGQAVTDGESIFGIWVSSVKSGSPADRAGVKPGDILTTMEGLVLATDGTMSSYCDILRGHNMGDTLAIEVLRLRDGTVLSGQMNGTPLEVIDTFDTGSGAEASGEFVTISDDSGSLVVTVPVEWDDINGAGWVYDGADVGLGLSASTDLAGYDAYWDVPGLFFGTSSSLRGQYDPASFLATMDFSSDCNFDGNFDYDDGYYVGTYDQYSDCGGVGSTFIVLVAEPSTQDVLLLLQIVQTPDTSDEVLNQIFGSFLLMAQ